ncbi:MAG: preprotein translocase subunit SecA [Pseudonocardiales bacterium]|nr:preprotein translocase subunit SecA [Pseudonocardiales bacterium]
MVLNRLLRAGETKLVRRLSRIADHVDTFEADVHGLTDAELRAKTDELRARYAEGETLDDLLPEAFAVVREGAVRTIGQRHFKVQLMGGAALHLGNVAEMRTGEGKTLTCVLPAYLNAISGDGVHVVTVNDYLAKRDAENMGRIHRFLGLSVGVILSEMSPAERREAYNSDITYGTNNEFGFDYLRDNMTWLTEDMVQRGHNFAVVDECDSILIDEARTPLIISGPAEQSARWYSEFARIAPLLRRDTHYEVDEGKRTVGVTEEGVGLVGADHRAVGGDRHHAQLVDLVQLGRLGLRGAGHPGQLAVEPEVVLQRDRGQGLVLLLDLDAFLGLDRLVQTLVVPASVQHPAGVLVDDQHLAVGDDVVLVALEQLLGLQRVVQVADQRGVDRLVQVVDADLVLDLLDGRLVDRHRPLALVALVVLVAL